MERLKLNDNSYMVFNTKEHFFKEKLSYPIKQYHEYDITGFMGEDIVYTNNKPVILKEEDSMVENYNKPGEIFLLLDPVETYYDVGKHCVERIWVSDKSKSTNYRLYSIDKNFRHYYFNEVPVIAKDFDKFGITLEENYELKLKRYRNR